MGSLTRPFPPRFAILVLFSRLYSPLSFNPTYPPEMALTRRQNITSNYVIFDDQSPALWDSYVGNWARDDHLSSTYYNNTLTATSTPGDSFTFTYTGTHVIGSWLSYVVLTLLGIGSYAILVGSLSNATTTEGNKFFLSYPTADYIVDGVICESPNGDAA